MRTFCLFVATLLLAPTLAWAQAVDAGPDPDGGAVMDGGGTPDAGDNCGPITPEGECQGSEVVYCNEGTVERIDCAMDYDPPAACVLIEASYGVDCAVATGDGCLYLDENDDYVQTFCQGTGAGCVETPNDVTCAPGVGACTETDIDHCRGDRLITDCLINQPYVIDCAAYGGTCSEGACRGVPTGSFCDPTLIQCADGNDCLPSTLDPQVYQCQARAAPDAGIAADAGTGGGTDAGPSPAPKQEEDSGCSASGRSSASGWWVALGVLGWWRRRQRG